MVLATVLVLIGLPALLVLSEAVWHHIRNRHNGSIVSSGETREYVLHVPKNYDRARPTPLVISLHGGALWGAAQMVISQWNGVAEREGVIVVYPSGSRGDGPRHWETNDEPSLMREVRFIADLVDTLSAGYHIDSRRIYADGLSNGGGMALVLSCRLSDRIAAIGMVAAAHFLPWDWCTERRAVPIIAFHRDGRPGDSISRRSHMGGSGPVSEHPDLHGESGPEKPVQNGARRLRRRGRRDPECLLALCRRRGRAALHRA